MALHFTAENKQCVEVKKTFLTHLVPQQTAKIHS